MEIRSDLLHASTINTLSSRNIGPSSFKTPIYKKTQITYRRAPNLKNIIAPSKLKSNCSHQSMTQPCLIPLKSIFQRHKPLCKTCNKFVHHGQKNFIAQGKTYPMNDFHCCSSDHVVYCLTCPCSLFYVGRTIRPLQKKIWWTPPIHRRREGYTQCSPQLCWVSWQINKVPTSLGHWSHAQ